MMTLGMVIGRHAYNALETLKSVVPALLDHPCDCSYVLLLYLIETRELGVSYGHQLPTV